jgi:hypothetical protein
MGQYELTIFGTESASTDLVRGFRLLADAIRAGESHAGREWEVTDEDDRIVWRHRTPKSGLGEYLAEYIGSGFDGSLEKSTS